MRGEHCIAGASILSAISLILLVFVNISQIKPGAVTNGLYFAEVNLDGMTTAINSANVGGPGGVFADNGTAALGEQEGARYKYRYGIFGELSASFVLGVVLGMRWQAAQGSLGVRAHDHAD
jgi:hypothetical protein